MRLHTLWFRGVIFGISGILALWLVVLFVSGRWFSDAPGYPFSVIFAGAWLVLVNLGWSLSRLRTATGYRRIPRILSVIAASLFAIGQLFIALDLLALSSNQSTSYRLPFWLLPVALFLVTGANLVETGWGKTNRGAWLHVIGAAVIGALVLLPSCLLGCSG